MARRGRPPKGGSQITIKSRETQVFLGFVFIVLGVSLFINNSLSGALPQIILKNFGQTTYILGGISVCVGLRMIGIKFFVTSDRFLWGLVLLLATTLPFLNFWIPEEVQIIRSQLGDGGGLVGMVIHRMLFNLMGRAAEFGILTVFLVVALSILSGISLAQIGDIMNSVFTFFLKSLSNIGAALQSSFAKKPEMVSKLVQEESEKSQESEQRELDLENEFNPKVKEMDVTEINLPEIGKDEASLKEGTATPKITISYGKDLQDKGKTKDEEPEISDLEKEFSTKYEPKFKDWMFPPLDLLEPSKPDPFDRTEADDTAALIKKTLTTFKIQANVSKYFVGPSVVQYALNLAPGTKFSKLAALSRDLSLALAATSENIRISNISGSSWIGIEVPRKQGYIVRLREVLASKEMSRDLRRLPLAIGRDVRGEIIVEDLQQMPHLLVAGATGTGKSVTINDLLVGLLMKFTPDELKLILVDPKMVEMSLYNGLPHLLIPVITEMDKVVSALEWAIHEMTQRYKLFKEKGVRNLDEFNESSSFRLPYIVIAIDEMADLILQKKSDVETKIVRLAQLARATGIHLILATQRPSVQVITGLIKANIPARFALGVTSSIDSRVILDNNGAESLIGKGDMLVKSPDAGKIRRVQAALVTGKEIHKIADFMKQRALAMRPEEDWYIDEVTEMQGDTVNAGAMTADAIDDPLFKQAVALVIQQGSASSSSLQRYLKIGFNRAARLIDQMTEMGVISAGSGSKKRDVLVSSLDDVFGEKSDETDPFS